MCLLTTVTLVATATSAVDVTEGQCGRDNAFRASQQLMIMLLLLSIALQM